MLTHSIVLERENFLVETMKTWFLRLLFIMLLFANSVSANTDNSVKVAMGEVYKGLTLERDLKIIYKAADIDVEFIYLPNERAIQSCGIRSI